MLQLFRPRKRLNRGVIRPGQIDYIQRTFTERLRILRKYYREKTFYIRNDHILVRLLVTGFGSLHTDRHTFVSTANERVDYLARHFQLTSPVSYGKIWYETFYGEGSYEILIADDTPFDIDDAILNWKTLSPVTVLTHSVSDFGLTLPNGKNNHYIEGLAVLLINIPMLMLQYRMFVEEQLRHQVNTGQDAILSPKLFIYRYVLPGMMPSHLDHVLINRIINLHSGAPMSEALTKSSFHEAESGMKEGSGLINMVDTAQQEVLKKITSITVEYEQALANIFTITEEDALEVLMLPDLARTRQVWWALLLSRLKHIRFLLEITSNKYGAKKNPFSSRISIDLTQLLNSHVLESCLSPILFEIVSDEIKQILELTND